MTAAQDQVAQIIISEAQSRNHTRNDCLAEMSALYQESGWDETIWDPTHTTYGVAQQDGSYPNRFQGAAAQVKAFFDKLDAKLTSPGTGNIWLDICWLQQAPNWPSAQYWWDNGRQAYLTEIQSRISTVTPYLDKYWPTTGDTPVTVPTSDPNKAAYNEFPIWSPSNQDRAGTKVDLFLIHTQEGGGGDSAAEDLANYLANPANQVSYHYTISQASDGGVTLVDVVDTDLAAWAVGDANDRSINLCFAGSSVSWTRDQWLEQSNAIDVAAYIAVQDCVKYSISTLVVPAPYTAGTPGISDHMYVTDILGWGTHTDVGPNFPWDVFAAAVAKYSALDVEPPAPPTPPVDPPVVDPPAPPAAPTPVGPADDQIDLRWNCLGGQTLVEAVAEIRDKLLGTNDRPKVGAL